MEFEIKRVGGIRCDTGGIQGILGAGETDVLHEMIHECSNWDEPKELRSPERSGR
jgi:hypothetical protein